MRPFAVARRLTDIFDLDEFVFIPAFHAPHKIRLEPTPALDRFAMLCLATKDELRLSVSKMEIDLPSKPFTIETLTRLKSLLPDAEIYFVMGADSWRDIRTWREWESVLMLTNHIVVTRPGYDIGVEHVTRDIQDRIVDLRGVAEADVVIENEDRIYLTDAVNLDISATAIREKVRAGDEAWKDELSVEVAKYIEKYQIYN